MELKGFIREFMGRAFDFLDGGLEKNRCFWEVSLFVLWMEV